MRHFRTTTYCILVLGLGHTLHQTQAYAPIPLVQFLRCRDLQGFVTRSKRPNYIHTPKRSRSQHEALQMQLRSNEDQASSFATTAAIAFSAVNAAVSMRTLEAPEVGKTYIVKDTSRIGKVDESGLPIVYDKELIEKYWRSQDGALQQRWREFLSVSIPFLTKMAAMLVRGGVEELKKNSAELARDARLNLEKLGPTYIKAGQMLSVRPDVLPKEALDELAALQDSVKPFDTSIAVKLIEKELGQPLGAFFSEISEEPVAAASLAQVYKAKLLSGETVAVKVQRPDVLQIVSKDLYVLRRAAQVYQGLIDRFAPQQKTNYVALFNEWAVGFYTELDFLNEAANIRKMREMLGALGNEGVYIPQVYPEVSTRRLLVTEWIEGVKLSQCPPEEIREYIAIGQECFLTQLLQLGFFHSDPHPGNIIRMADQSKGKIALIDFGLVASLQQEDIDNIVSSIVHLANKDYAALVDDFIRLNILPPNCDRAKVVPLMDKALSPYVRGGGAQRYEEELRRIYGMDGSAQAAMGGFKAMTQDALTVLNDIPFSIPPYFALIARAVVTLEGVALIGNPDYGLIMEAYPFVARKLLREDRPEVQKALQEVLYAGGGLKGARLSVLLNGAMGVVARTKGGAFIDFDTVPDQSVSLQQALSYLLSPAARSLRQLLIGEAVNAADVLLRQAARKAYGTLFNSIPRPPLVASFLPRPETLPAPFLLPRADGRAVPVVASPAKVVEAAAPRLTREEELYAISLTDLVAAALGPDAAVLAGGDALLQPRAVARLLSSILTTGRAPPVDNIPPQVRDTAAALLAALAGSAGQKGGAEGEGRGREEVWEALEGLTVEEREVLDGAVRHVAQALWDHLLLRLAPLLPPSPRSFAPPAPPSAPLRPSTPSKPPRGQQPQAAAAPAYGGGGGHVPAEGRDLDAGAEKAAVGAR